MSGSPGPLPGNADLTVGDTPGKAGNRVSPPYRAWMTKVGNALINLGGKSTTAMRPVQNLYPGLVYMDTTLGKPVFVLTEGPPAVWVDATGAIV